MSKKKKAKFRADQSSGASSTTSPPVPIAPLPASVPLSSQDPAAVVKAMQFDDMEEKIRGEEILLRHENAARKEEEKFNKAIKENEIDRRLNELRRQLGLKK